MKVGIIAFCIFCSGFFSYSQNLVLNPGFEDHGEISGNGSGTDNLKGNHVKNWISPTSGSPDYFSTASDYLWNQYGKPKSHSGFAMAGIVIYGGKKEYREYIMGEFSSPLEAGKKYDFSISIALAEFCGVNIDKIEIYFSKDKFENKKTDQALKLIPQIFIDSTDQKGMEGKWIVFHESYTAVGGEKYFTLGNYLSDKKTPNGKTSTAQDGSLPYAYYYFDDVSLVPFVEKERIDPIDINNTVEKPKDTLEIVAGKKLIVDNIYFEVDQSILKKESFPILDEIISAMKDQPNLKVKIDGHTDADGTAEHNLKLSQARSKSVEAYFVSKGIDPARISTNGFGSTKPISSDKNKNRRVEFIFSN